MKRHRRPFPLRFLPLEDRLTPAQLLPDLSPDASNLGGWTVSTVGGITELAYATGMRNLGQGAFELRGTTTIITNGDGTQSQQVNQRVYDPAEPLGYSERIAGYFTYHPTHGHVHYDDFAWGRIRTRPTANWQDGTIVAEGPKTSFCLMDSQRLSPALPNSPLSAVYASCSSQVQGISVGWKDVYTSNLDGQQINVTGLPNGDYWLEVVADPMNRVLELDETNNTTRIEITLKSQPAVGMMILSSSPLGANNGPVDHVDVNFNYAPVEASFQPEDVTFNGPSGAIPITGISKNSSTSYRINFANQVQVGTYQMLIGPNIINATDSKLMNQDNDSNYGEAPDDQYVNIFTITAPHVIGTSPSGSTSNAVSSVRFTYNKPLDTSTFTFADIVSFTGPGGGDLMGQISGVVPVTPGTSALFDINFATMTGFGTYQLVIEPNMTDALGNSVDQNGDLVTNSADRFTASFTIVPLGTVGPDAFGYTAKAAGYEDFTGLTTGWTTLHSTGDDSNVAANLGTNTFNFHGVTYTGTQMFVSTNGLITFGQGSNAYSNNDLSGLTYNSTTIYPPALAPLWDDWYNGDGVPSVRGRLQDTTGDGNPDRYIVEWNQIHHYDRRVAGAGVSFQAILQLNTGVVPGNVTFNYQDLDNGSVTQSNGATATVGERAAGSSGTRLLVSQNSNSNALVGSLKALTISVPKVQSIQRLDPATPAADAGDVEFLVTFTDGVSGVDPDDFTLTTTGNIAGAHVDHIHSTANPAVYEVHVHTGTGSGTLKLNVADNDSIVSVLGAKLGGTGSSNGSFSAGESYVITQPAPGVMGHNIGDGTGQRSMIDQVVIVFDWPVVFAGNPSNAFSVIGPSGPVAVTVDTSASGEHQTVARLTFSGPGTSNGSLADGLFTIKALGSQISTGGVALDGDDDGNAGGDYSFTVGRLFGDYDGNQITDSFDFVAFGNEFNKTLADSPFDFNRDGIVDVLDFVEFGGRFNVTL